MYVCVCVCVCVLGGGECFCLDHTLYAGGNWISAEEQEELDAMKEDEASRQPKDLNERLKILKQACILHGETTFGAVVFVELFSISVYDSTRIPVRLHLCVCVCVCVCVCARALTYALNRKSSNGSSHEAIPCLWINPIPQCFARRCICFMMGCVPVWLHTAHLCLCASVCVCVCVCVCVYVRSRNRTAKKCSRKEVLSKLMSADNHAYVLFAQYDFNKTTTRTVAVTLDDAAELGEGYFGLPDGFDRVTEYGTQDDFDDGGGWVHDARPHVP